MPTRPFFEGSLLVMSAFAVGCGGSDAPTAVAELNGLGPRFNFANGPSTPNVFKGEGGIVFTFFDPESGLDVWVGLPAEPSEVFLCGGPSFDIGHASFQNAGQLKDGFNFLVLARDINIRVYAPDADVCVDSPIAQGTGNLTSNGHDVLTAGPGANSFNLRIQGTLDDLVNGGKVHVTGAFHFMFLPDGSFRILRQSIDLHPIGKK